ncbi:uncharacterized protein LOC124200050 isoform X1 [Daphnia pulex]|uniref:uncharacterized protein LOC124200050 isoform X1 n=1 Tax=Daphnia pulex TaxID=6669 RepID=UPI001EDD5756|nr:uncharacterized protein LOC124200050 isoform X1 [Daphnia pulex]
MIQPPWLSNCKKYFLYPGINLGDPLNNPQAWGAELFSKKNFPTSNFLEWKLEAVLNLQDKKSYSKARKRVKRFTANPSLLWEESGSELIVNGTRDVRPVNFSDYDYEVTKVRRWKKGASNNRDTRNEVISVAATADGSNNGISELTEGKDPETVTTPNPVKEKSDCEKSMAYADDDPFLLASTCPDPPMNIVNPPPVTIKHRDQSSSISSGSLQFSSDDYNKGFNAGYSICSFFCRGNCHTFCHTLFK